MADICGECSYYQDRDKVESNNGTVYGNGWCLQQSEVRGYNQEVCEDYPQLMKDYWGDCCEDD